MLVQPLSLIQVIQTHTVQEKRLFVELVPTLQQAFQFEQAPDVHDFLYVHEGQVGHLRRSKAKTMIPNQATFSGG
jgi:hypothetical protein